MMYNDIIEMEVTTDITTEPVSLEALKQHMNMVFDTSGSYEFNDDDNYLQGLIIIARKALENYTGLSFGPKTIRAIIRNECGGQELPGGPRILITSVKDVDGNTLETGAMGVFSASIGGNYKVTGNSFKSFLYPTSCYLDVEYTAGYTVLPDPLKRAIMEQCQFMYDNRGSQRQSHQNVIFDLSTSSRQLAAPYKRTSILA